jgi:uncharacterized membrane protein
VAAAALAVIGMGLLLILVGTVVTVLDWWHERSSHDRNPEIETEALNLGGNITALQKLLAELSKHPLGTRLIVLGIVCVLLGGVLGGVAGIAG